MADEASRPSSEQVVADLLRLGELLALHARPIGALGLTRRIRQEESARLKAEIAELEKRIETQAYDKSRRALRSVLGLQKDEVLDMIFLRCIAVVAFEALDNFRAVSTVAGVSKAVGLGDWSSTLDARHTIRQAIIKGSTISYSEEGCEGGVLKVGRNLIRFMSGENRLGILWTDESLKQEKEEFLRRQGNALKKASTPTESPAPSAQPSPANASAIGSLSSPKAIFEALRKTVIGMDPVVRRFSVQMALHLKRVAIMESGGKNTTPPVCFLLAGPSGAGKTFLAEEFGKLSGLPFCIGDMSSVTASAYVGISVDELFYGFSQKGTTLVDAHKSVLFLDEIDKKRTNFRGGDYDATGVGVQYELLRMIEGARIQIGGKRSTDNPKGFIDTSSMAFILGGAFSSISEALAEKKNKAKGPIGFSGGSDAVGMAPDVRELLLDYFIPELVNRIGSVIVVPTPSRSQLIEIAWAPTGIIARQNQFLSSFGLQVLPTLEGVKELASWALETRTFSRGMRNLMQNIVEEVIFEERKGTIVITGTDVRRAVEGLRREPEGLS
ncbi:MAG: AAA family ATPase [Bacteroidia bacterium]|nr:AAA family ATPase [Bacteroidia bacterium]